MGARPATGISIRSISAAAAALKGVSVVEGGVFALFGESTQMQWNGTKEKELELFMISLLYRKSRVFLFQR